MIFLYPLNFESPWHLDAWLKMGGQTKKPQNFTEWLCFQSYYGGVPRWISPRRVRHPGTGTASAHYRVEHLENESGDLMKVNGPKVWANSLAVKDR